MPIEPIKKKTDSQRTDQKDQQMDQVFTGQEDDIGSNYLQSRQVAHEYYSPAVQAYRDSLFEENIQQPEQGVKTQVGEGEAAKPWPRKPEKEEPGLEEPWIDPVSAFAGGAAGVGWMSFKAGMGLMPSLGRAFLSGTVGSIADYPIGVATEKVGEKVPGLALPFNVLAGLVSGATIEKAIEDGVTAGFKKLGQKVSPEDISRTVQQMKALLADETGAIGERPSEEIAESVIESLNQVAPTAKAKAAGKKILVSIGAKPETEVKASQLHIQDLAGLELKDKAININFKNIETEDDVKRIIQQVSEVYGEEIQVARRGKVSNVQTQNLAETAGISPQQLLARRKGQAFSAEEALGARMVLISSAENVHGLAQRVMTLDATDMDKIEFRKALNLHYAIQAQVSGMTAEAGRTLQSFKIPAGAGEVQTRTIKELLHKLPGDVSIEQMATAIASMDSAEGISRAIPKMLRATTTDMFIEAWVNGLLWNPPTHVVNQVSTGLFNVWQIPERYAAALIGRVLPGEQVIKESEALYQAYGLVEGFKDGLRAFAKTMRTGMSTDEMTKIELARHRAITAANVRQLPLIQKLAPNALQEGGIAARAVDLLGEVVRLPGRGLMAGDDLWKSVGYRMELNAQAIRRAAQEGLSGDAAAERIAQIKLNPEQYAPDIHLAAIDMARYQTFTQPLDSKILGAISQSKNPLVKMIAPFMRTPTNLVMGGIERSPLAFTLKNVRADVMAGGARRDLALARMSLGSMIMITATIMAAEGFITGGGPSDPKLQANLRRQGWQPYSLKVGNKYIQFNRIEPLGMLFGMAGDFAEISGMAGEEMSPEMENLASAIIGAISKNVTSKTWLRGASEFVEAHSDWDRYGNRYIQNYARSFVPTIVGGAERALDPEAEAVYGVIDAIKSRIPGLSDSLMPRRDMWGKPITTQIGKDDSWAEKAYRFLSPIYVSEGKDSPIDKELTRMKVGLSKPTKEQSIFGVSIPLSPQEYDDFIVLMNKTPIMGNKNLKESLDDFVKKPLYKQLTDDQKEAKIRQIISKAREIGRIKLVEKYPYLADIAMELKRRLAEPP